MSWSRRWSVGLALAAGLLVAGVCAAPGCVRALVFERLGPRPLGPFETPAGLLSLRARDCGDCHQEIYAEWRGSQMGGSFADPAFQVDWEEQGRSFLCLNCHAPLVNQHERRAVGLVSLDPLVAREEANPTFDPELRAEGITCVACHYRDGALVGPHADPDVPPHPVLVDRRLGDVCRACHQFDPPGSDLARPPADAHGEWQVWQRLTGRTEGCVDCHMPPVERKLVASGPLRFGRRHTFRGGDDLELLRAGLFVGKPVCVTGGVAVELENRAGHHYPTTEPVRLVLVSVELSPGGARREARIGRRIAIPELVEEWDTSLRPAERRRLLLAFSDDELARATRADVLVRYFRFGLRDGGAPLGPASDPGVVVARTSAAIAAPGE